MKLIYLFNIEGTDIYKIGITKGDPLKRLKNLQVGCPFSYIISCTFESKHGNKLEKVLHRTYSSNKVLTEGELPTFIIRDFSDKELHGEFFKLNKEEVENFENTCKRIENNIDIIKNNSTLDKF